MSKIVAGNLFLGLSIVLATISQVMLKALVSEVDGTAGFMQTLRQVLASSRCWRAALVMVTILAGFACWVMCLTRLDLSYAYPITCGSALLMVLLSAAFLGESVTPRVWIGTCLIMAGAMLLAPMK